MLKGCLHINGWPKHGIRSLITAVLCVNNILPYVRQLWSLRGNFLIDAQQHYDDPFDAMFGSPVVHIL
jgi:hypothetical protein